MNSIRIKDNPQRAFLKVSKVSEKDGKTTLRSQLFDGTNFDFTVHNYEYESQGEDLPLLVEVGLVGNVGNVSNSGILEIMLPAPVLNLGHSVRVSEGSLIRWDFYNLIKEKNNAAKKSN